MGSMMRVSWQWVRQRIYAGVVAAGYEDLTPADVALFRYPTLDGLRPTEVAEQAQLSKQSVNDLLGHLEHRGYIARKPDPSDGRGRVVRLTAKGRRLEQVVYDAAEQAELHIAALLGPRRFTQLRTALTELTSQLNHDASASERNA